MKYSIDFIRDLKENFEDKNISYPVEEINSKPIPVIEVSNELSLNKVIANWREYQKAKTFFRGQSKFHQQIPISGKERNDLSNPSSSALCNKEKTLEFILACPGINILERGKSKLDFWASLDAISQSQNKIDGLGGAGTYTNQHVPEYALEGLLQQYIGSTRWIDVVDNLQIALWMATRSYIPQLPENFDKVNCYNPIKVSEIKYDEDAYIYLYMYSFTPSKIIDLGLYQSEDSLLLDLREALPSRYLRPHSQHAMLLREYKSTEKLTDPKTTNVVGVKLKTKLAISAIGNSSLINNQTIFPNEENDSGFKTISQLLSVYWLNGQNRVQDKISQEQFLPRYL
ncbi:hypothetical protein [Rothia terrae]|uniref:FRG domain-containing protein n=1 Tax=Rothia terrae TaxID=396015 RepID=A0A7H2BFG9_9MICC|nr:hypothetical protein [Rothia terrae]QNV38415.1 hypothetical protein IDM49_03865 [Rothia terrae]